MNRLIDLFIDEERRRQEVPEPEETATEGTTESITMPRSAEELTALATAKSRHKSTSMALTMALKTAEDARKEADVTKNKMAPLIQRVKNAQDKYEEAALAVIACAETDDPTADPDVKPYIEKFEAYNSRVDAFLTAIADITKKEEKKDETEYLKIPFTKIKDFDGSDPSQFKAWYATHLQCVAANPNVPKIQKYLHLYNSCKGKALECIAGLPFEDENYEEAKRLLENRYASKRSLSELIAKLKNVEPLTAFKAKDQRKLLSLLLSLHRAIKHHDKITKTSDYNTLFVSIVKEKLPSFFVRKYEEQHGKVDDEAYNKLTIDHLLDAYQVSVEAQEVMEETQPTKDKDGDKKDDSKNGSKKNHKKQTKKDEEHKFTIEEIQATFATMASKKGQPKKEQKKGEASKSSDPPKCVECGGSHFASNCTTEMPPQQRIKKLKDAGCCINCKGRFHTSETCKKSHACTKCTELPKHHTSCHQ